METCVCHVYKFPVQYLLILGDMSLLHLHCVHSCVETFYFGIQRVFVLFLDSLHCPKMYNPFLVQI